jgi:hypothetical protein
MLEQHWLSLHQDFNAMGQERQNGGYQWISRVRLKLRQTSNQDNPLFY